MFLNTFLKFFFVLPLIFDFKKVVKTCAFCLFFRREKIMFFIYLGAKIKQFEQIINTCCVKGIVKRRNVFCFSTLHILTVHPWALRFDASCFRFDHAPWAVRLYFRFHFNVSRFCFDRAPMGLPFRRFTCPF